MKIPIEGSVLDHPIEKQHEYASRRGMSLEDWRKRTIELHKEAEAFRAELDANKGVRPEGWTDEDAKRFQAKIDSGNPPA